MIRVKSILGCLFCCAFGIANAGADQSCDMELGEKIFQKCVVCHSMSDDGVHSIGPNLHGLLDRPVGKAEGFKFTRQLRKSEQSWSGEYLDAFLEAPMVVYPRTSMAFAGLKKAEDRTAVICYMAE